MHYNLRKPETRGLLLVIASPAQDDKSMFLIADDGAGPHSWGHPSLPRRRLGDGAGLSSADGWWGVGEGGYRLQSGAQASEEATLN